MNTGIHQIESDLLQVKIKEAGAELSSIFNRQTNLDYLWQAGPSWPKQAPVLFPIVGQLKDNTYFHHNKSYHLERHGFARTLPFIPLNKKKDSITFLLRYNEETLSSYPFMFLLSVDYRILSDTLQVVYTVTNEGEETMPFSIGAHPAFRVPLFEKEAYEDYYLQFEKKENADRLLLTNGLIAEKREAAFLNGEILPLAKSLFYRDALVFKNLKSERISIRSKNHPHGLHFDFKGYPYFGIWAARDADFICLEPWQGIADPVHHNMHLSDKEGMLTLDPGKSASFKYHLILF